MNLRTLENLFYRGVRDSRAEGIAGRPVCAWRTSELRDYKYCLLTTYRRDGRLVNTPVWFGIEGDRAYVRSGAQDGKVKRIRRHPRVLVTPCGARGKPLGNPMEGLARILGSDEHARAEDALRAHYGRGRKIYRLLRRRLDTAYIEISPPATSS